MQPILIAERMHKCRRVEVCDVHTSRPNHLSRYVRYTREFLVATDDSSHLPNELPAHRDRHPDDETARVVYRVPMSWVEIELVREGEFNDIQREIGAAAVAPAYVWLFLCGYETRHEVHVETWLSIGEVGERLGVPLATARKLDLARMLPLSHGHGRRKRWRESDIQKLVERG